MNKKIAVLAGDGIGPEVMSQALRVLQTVAGRFGHRFDFAEALVGGAAYERHGSHCPAETLEICRGADAILFGSVGGPVTEAHLPKWNRCEANSLLGIRKAFRFHANFRPVKIFPELKGASPLRADILEQGVDLLIIRELLGDIYFGEKKLSGESGRRVARDVAEYSEEQIAGVAHQAFQAARRRRRKVTSVDKANVLEISRLWRAVVREVGAGYPDVALEDMLVDNCAMQLILRPGQFDVILASNMFGDILSDEAAVLAGSLGMLCSASFNPDGFGFYEPPGGSAPDLTGRNSANPIGQILSAALMLRHSFGAEPEAKAVEDAVARTIASGWRTQDIAGPGGKIIGTREMADEIIARI